MTILKKDRIYALLRQRIESGDYAPGVRLPRELEFARECGVSFITLRAALARLAAEGLIDRLPGRGTFVRETPRRNAAVKLLLTVRCNFTPEWPVERDFFHRELFSGALEECYLRGWQLELVEAKNRAAALERAANGEFAGVICDRPRPEEYADISNLRRAGVPTVVTYRRTPEVPYVVLDNAGGMIRLVRYLNSIGHRDLALIDFSMDNPIVRERHDAFRRELREQGVPEVEKRCILSVTPPTPEAIAAGLKRCGNFTALILGSACYRNFHAYLSSAPFRVPGDVSIVQWGECNLADAVTSPYSVMTEARPEVGRTAVRLIARSYAGESLPPENSVPGELIIRGGCASPDYLLESAARLAEERRRA